MVRVPQGRIIIRGTLASGAEQWTMSHAVDPLDSRTQAELETIASLALDIFRLDVWEDATLSPFISTQTALTGVRVDDVQDPGGVVRTAEVSLVEPSTGTGAVFQLPSEVCEVVSLRTGTPGASYRGRMFFPALGTSAIGSNGQMAGSAQVALADAMQDYFQGVNSSAGMAVTAFVASDVKQQLTAISSIQVGETFDVQRRRRNDLPEAYISRTI